MANTNNPNGFKAVKYNGGSAFPMYTYNTKSNLSLSPGDAVILLTNGTIDKAVVGSTAIFGVCQTSVVAVAATRKQITIIPAIPDIVWSGQYGASKNSSSNPNWGTSIDINGASGAMLLTTTTGQGVARILGLEPALDNAAGAYSRALFVWNKSQWSGQA